MKLNRVSASILPFALAGLLLAGGCKKQAQQANNETPAAAPADQSAAPAATPAPPPDASGAPAAASQPAPSSTAAPAPAPMAAAPAPAPAPPPPPPVLVIPAGTHIAVTVQEALGSKISQTGQTFSATVASPVVVDGKTVIRAGASATGTVVDAKALGRFKGGAVLSLRLDT